MTTSSLIVSIDAPAKINLGLELLGRRPDGFHEIRTLMAMLEFGDRLTLATSSETKVLGVDGVDQGTNLISRAVNVFHQATGTRFDTCVHVSKRTPIAAGLGGASADAAATLLALMPLADVELPHGSLHGLAEALGSDVPFFLGSPLARGSGTGTTLAPLQPFAFDVILVVPKLAIPNKTQRLYGMIDDSDVSDGMRIADGNRCLDSGTLPDRPFLANAFERPLYALAPDLVDLRRVLDSLDCLRVGLSGAGPAHYVIPNPGSERECERALHRLMPRGTTIISTRSRLRRLQPEPHAQRTSGTP